MQMKMHMRTLVPILAAALGLMANGRAAATTYSMSLAGTVSAGTYSSYDANFYHVEAWDLPLSGLSAAPPLTVLGRDSIRAVVTLDSPITVPPSAVKIVDLTLTGTLPMGSRVRIVHTTMLYLGTSFAGGAFSWRDAGFSSTHIQVGATIYQPEASQPVTFDSLRSEIVLDTSTVGSMTITGASLGYRLLSPIPQPATGFMLAMGLGLVLVATSKARAGATC